VCKASTFVSVASKGAVDLKALVLVDKHKKVIQEIAPQQK
jgi:hypothetical protein